MGPSNLREDVGDVQVAPEEAGAAAAGPDGLWSSVRSVYFQALAIGVPAVFVVGACLVALRRPLWSDEVYTAYFTRLPGPAALWAALKTGIEVSPPGFYLLEKGAVHVLGETRFSLRLPEVLSLIAVSFCLWKFVSRRLGQTAAAVAVLIPVLGFSRYYFSEARPYALVLALGAACLWFWQEATSNPRRTPWLVLLALGGFAATSAHYYAVFIAVPLAAGEVVRSWSRRRIDFPVWAAFAALFLPLAIFFPQIQAGRNFATSFWAVPEWKQALTFFQWWSQNLRVKGVLAAFILIPAIVVGPAGWRKIWGRLQHSGFPGHELLASGTFLLIPAMEVLAAKTVTGAFTPRYAIAAVVGVAVIAALWASALDGVVPGFSGWLAIFLTVLALIGLGRNIRSANVQAVAQARVIDFLEHRPGADQDVVVAETHQFVELTYASPRDLSSRLLYLADPKKALRMTGVDIVDKLLLESPKVVPLRVSSADDYLSKGGPFQLLDRAGQFNWLFDDLRNRGVKMRLIGAVDQQSLYQVRP